MKSYWIGITETDDERGKAVRGEVKFIATDEVNEVHQLSIFIRQMLRSLEASRSQESEVYMVELKTEAREKPRRIEPLELQYSIDTYDVARKLNDVIDDRNERLGV